MRDGGPQLKGILDRGCVIGEVDDLYIVKPAKGCIHIAVLRGCSPCLDLGQAPVLGNVDHAAKGRSVGPVLDLDAVPVQPTQVDGKPHDSYENHEDEGHQGKHRATLACSDLVLTRILQEHRSPQGRLRGASATRQDRLVPVY